MYHQSTLQFYCETSKFKTNKNYSFFFGLRCILIVKSFQTKSQCRVIQRKKEIIKMKEKPKIQLKNIYDLKYYNKRIRFIKKKSSHKNTNY